MWATRRANRGDLDGLRALCLASVGPDDYVPRFLERFVRESVTLVALDRGQIIGMMVYDETPDGGVWLHAGRTHPDYRRQGVATSLNQTSERLARAHGRSSLRLWAHASNAASLAAARKAGFEERATFTRMRAAAAPGRTVGLEPLSASDAFALRTSLPFLRPSAGYLFHDFYFMPLTRSTASWLSHHGALWRFGGNAVSLSADFEDPEGTDLQMQLLGGHAEAILRAAPTIAGSRGAGRVESFLPHVPALLRTARACGFSAMEWGQEAVLLEKRLGRVRGKVGPTGSARAGRTRS